MSQKITKIKSKFEKIKTFLTKENGKHFGILKGIANKINVLDAHRDISAKGSFDKTIKKNPTIPFLPNHETFWGMPLGTANLSTDKIGNLVAEMKFNLEVQASKEYYSLAKQFIEDKTPINLSIGGYVVKSETNEKEKIRTIKEWDIKELSIVNFGANPGSEITNIIKNLKTQNLDINKENKKIEIIKTKLKIFQTII